MKMKKFAPLRVLKGMLIGAAGMIPGASGGIIAVAMGEYRPALDAIYDLIRHPIKNFRSSLGFLFPLGIGGVMGLILCSFLLEYMLLYHEEPMMFVLMGMVLGGVPSLIRDGNVQRGFRPVYLLFVLLGGLLVSLMALLDNSITGESAWVLNGWTAMLGGGIITVGVVIPGISTSFILMYMGLYVPLLSALTHLNIPILLCMGMGAVLVGGLLFLLVRHLFKKHSAYTNYAILGFLLGTIYLIFPGFDTGRILWDCLLLAAGFLLTLFVSRRSGE